MLKNYSINDVLQVS